MKRRAPREEPFWQSPIGASAAVTRLDSPRTKAKKAQVMNHNSNLFLPCPIVAATILLGIGLAELVLFGGSFRDVPLLLVHDLTPNIGALSTYIGTMSPGQTKRDETVFITIKTARRNHGARVAGILDTYWNFAPQSIAFISDNHTSEEFSAAENLLMEPILTMNDPPITNPTKDHFTLVNSDCPPGHDLKSLCCKTSKEITYYHRHSTAHWMCHLDDDTYLNYPALVEYLEQYNATEEYFIGYGSINWTVFTNKDFKPKPIKLGKKRLSLSLNVRTTVRTLGEEEKAGLVRVSYGTGGAGWCLSRPLVERGIGFFTNFVAECMDLDTPDDITLGYITQEKLGVRMKLERRLHSHLDVQKFQSKDEAMEQLTFGASNHKKMDLRHLVLPSWPGSYLVNKTTGFPPEDDPLGFRALHNSLFSG